MVLYGLTINVLTITLLHHNNIGLIHQGSLSEYESLDSTMSSSNFKSIEGNEVLRSRYLENLSVVCRQAGKGAKLEDLGEAVPSNHLL